MSTNLIQREDRGSVTILTLNRPDQRNALSRALVAELRDALERVSVDERVRVVVLTGAGSTFCSGMDLKEAASAADAAESEQTTIAILEQFADLLQCLHTLPKPTIAAVNGDALAGGAGLMAACDLAVAAATRSDRLPGGQAWPGAVDRHPRSLAPDWRSSLAPVGALAASRSRPRLPWTGEWSIW